MNSFRYKIVILTIIASLIIIYSEDCNASIIRFTSFAGQGLCATSGPFPNPDTQYHESHTAYNFGGGLIVMNTFTSGFLGLIQYSTRNVAYHNGLTPNKTDSYYFETHLIDLALGYRWYVDRVFFDAGLFYGVGLRNWSQLYRNYITGEVSEIPLDELNNVKYKDEFGCFFSMGYSLPIVNYLNLDITLKAQTSFLYSVIVNDNIKLKDNYLTVTLGLTFFL